MQYFKILSLYIVFFWVTGCKAPALVQHPIQHKPMPTVYSGALKDTINIAAIQWKNYFTDKNLVRLIDTALRHNTDMLMTLQKIEMARQDLHLAQGALRPYGFGGFAPSLQKFGRYTAEGAGNLSTEMTAGKPIPTHLPNLALGIQTYWEADIWGKLRNKTKAAQTRYLSTLEGKNVIQTNLISVVANIYYELLFLDDELDIIREAIQLQQNALDIVIAQKQAAVTNELAVKEFQAQVLNSQSLEFEVLQKIQQNEKFLNFLLGRFPQPIVRNKINMLNLIPQQWNIGTPMQLLKNRPDIKQAALELIATQYDVKAAQAAFLPSLTLNGRLGLEAFNLKFLLTSPQSLAYSLIGDMFAPVFNRSAIEAHFYTTNARQVEAIHQYQKTILNGYVEVATEIDNIKNLDKIQSLKSQEVAALTQSIDIANDLFKTGKANYLEILTAQHLVLQAKIELANVQKRRLNVFVNIYKALGGGWY